jgi:hypothetical protein
MMPATRGFGSTHNRSSKADVNVPHPRCPLRAPFYVPFDADRSSRAPLGGDNHVANFDGSDIPSIPNLVVECSRTWSRCGSHIPGEPE